MRPTEQLNTIIIFIIIKQPWLHEFCEFVDPHEHKIPGETFKGHRNYYKNIKQKYKAKYKAMCAFSKQKILTLFAFLLLLFLQ